ncbi:flavin reductase family protein [Samsonia erythrinae]|uniref:Flavin reductase (DIM6/NTAB) family NADH-FMN oxidoreductase RutF n=1 Tax=Samsonia erythrinae TaxID=160434 RepID=A0A4R3VQJ7_9GAMM|nr:flavin reductase family protein [Samsonia erythrinae]TCV06965.1 flavin reductase (DIM6/NTAB) family NADH-FMN oxidoreductase RutF [Samsonia erythrinae]
MHDSLPADKAYRILESGPVVLVSTRGIDGRTNLMTMGFHMMIQHAPPLVGAIIGPWDYSHQALSDTGECVLAVPTVELTEKVVDIGNCSGETDDKFARFGLTPAPALTVNAPLVRECWANLECQVVDDSWARRYNLWVLEVQRIWLDTSRRNVRLVHHQGDGRFSVDGDLIDFSEKMVKWRDLMA